MKSVLSVTTGFLDFSNEEIANLRHGSWRVDCPKMILKSRSPNQPATLFGAGAITQDADHRIEFKFYSNRTRNAPRWQGYPTVATGRVIPDQAFYDLTAVDVKGRCWTCERILPDFDWSVSGQAVVTGGISELAATARLRNRGRQRGNSLRLQIFNRAKIPCNAMTKSRTSIAGKSRSRSGTVNAWKFRCLGFEFLILKPDEEVITVEISSKSRQFPDYFEQRVVEALQFMLARPIHWSVLDIWQEDNRTIVLANQPTPENPKRSFPILPDIVANPNTGKRTTLYHRRLFEQYLKHVLSQGEKRHPLWGQINAVHESGQGTFIDAQALTLTVAIESLLGSEFAALAKPTKSQEKAIRNATEYLEDWTGNAEIRKRAKGSISQLLQSRAGDKMRKLVALGVITEDQRQAWQTLRNASTHTYQSAGITPDKFRELIFKVNVLFCRLIFRAIGYRGPYLDVSSSGWPLKNYP